jgi:hypothetical protein
MFSISNKFIFFHPGRSGGTSIKSFLTSQVDDCIRCGHESLDEICDRIRGYDKDPNQFFKFTCVRNPWDRMVSVYLNTQKRYGFNDRHLINQIDHFRLHLYKTLEINTLGPRQFFNLFPDYRKFDLVIRLEYLKEDMAKLCHTLNIDFDIDDIPATNQSNFHAPYSLFYNKQSSELISKHFKQCIDMFKYEQFLY